MPDESRAPRSLLDARRVCRFLGDLGHEVGTPLGSVLMATEILADAPDLPNRHRRLVRDLHDAAVEVRTTVRRAVELVRVQTGHLETSFARFPASDIETRLREQAGSRATLEIGALSATFETDLPRLEEVVGHLLAFARATGSGEPPRVVVESVVDADPPSWRLVFDLFGVAVPDEPEVVLDPLDREGLQASRRQGGDGLELALSAQLATRLGGELRLEALDDGRGLRVVVELPVIGRDPLAAPG